jgi:hypothetical protein
LVDAPRDLGKQLKPVETIGTGLDGIDVQASWFEFRLGFELFSGEPCGPGARRLHADRGNIHGAALASALVGTMGGPDVIWCR